MADTMWLTGALKVLTWAIGGAFGWLVSLLAMPLGTVVAFGTMLVTMALALIHRRTQQQNLRQNLFDKRFAVYTAVEAFIASVLKTADGKFEIYDFRLFVDAAERAKFLFGSDVNGYLKEIRDKAKCLYPKGHERSRLQSFGEDASNLEADINAILMEFAGDMLERRTKVFRRYLKLHP